jgi:hypothetical protein
VCLIPGGVLSRFRLGEPFQVFCSLGDDNPLDRCERIKVLRKLRLCVSSALFMSSKTVRAAGLIPATASSSSSRINALRCILFSPVCAIDASKKVGITFQLPFSSTAGYLIALCVQNIAGFEKDNFIERPLRDYLRLFNFIHDLKDDLIRHG